MKQYNQAMKFFFSYFKLYKIQFLVIAIFIIAATVFQVEAPKLLGDAITNLTTYVQDFFAHQAMSDKGYITQAQDQLKGIAGQLHVSDWRTLTDHNVPTQVLESVKAHGQTINGLHKIATNVAPSKSTFMNGMWLLLAFYIFMGIAQLIYTLLFSRIVAHSTNRMRKGLFGKLSRLTISYFDRHQDGEILARFTSDLDNIQNSLNQALVSVVSNLALFIGYIIVMFRDNWQLTLITVVTTPFAIISAVVIIRQAKKYTDLQQKEVGKLNAYMDEKISGQKAIIVEGLEEDAIHGFLGHNDKVRKSTFAAQAWGGMIFPIMNGFSLLNIAILLFAGTSYLINSGGYSTPVALGLIVTFLTYSQNYYQPIMQISSNFGQLQLAITGADRLKVMFDEKEEIRPENGKIFDKVSDAVKLEHLDFSYIEGKPVLKNVNIDVKKGQMIALVGPTGSGKTTVMNLMNRFYDVNDGSIKFDGTDIREFDLDSLRSRVGIV
ncbi:MAG: ABC transporter ATP-binding protein/permease, partial [Streptococcaceae bacterium]|nr:ABC transporter ATP-binding protein/permease [Streptococcaceae bacterium]